MEVGKHLYNQDIVDLNANLNSALMQNAINISLSHFLVIEIKSLL